MQGPYYGTPSTYQAPPQYGQPQPVVYAQPVPVQTQPNTVIVKEKNTTSTGEAAAAGCCGACLEVGSS